MGKRLWETIHAIFHARTRGEDRARTDLDRLSKATVSALSEATIDGYEAVALGVDALEFDLRVSRDGVLMVFHDATLERTTDAAGPLADPYRRGARPRRRRRELHVRGAAPSRGEAAV